MVRHDRVGVAGAMYGTPGRSGKARESLASLWTRSVRGRRREGALPGAGGTGSAPTVHATVPRPDVARSPSLRNVARRLTMLADGASRDERGLAREGRAR